MIRRMADRVDAVRAALERKVNSGLLRPGERFQSARGVARRHGVSYQTADRLLREMCAAGLLVRRPRSGTFLPGGGGAALRRVALVFHARGRRPGSFGDRLLSHLRPALAGLGVGRVRWVDGDDATLPPPPADALPIVWDAPLAAHAWAEAGRRVLLVNDRPDPSAGVAALRIDSVGVDDHAGGAAAADLLLRLTAKAGRLSVLGGPGHDPRAVDRTRGFVDRLRRVAPRRLLSVSSVGGWETADGTGAAERALAGDPAGLFCGNDRLAEGVAAWCESTRRAVPLLVGFDDAPVADRLHLTTVAIPWPSLAAGVRQVAARRLADPPRDPAVRLAYAPTPVIRSLGLTGP